MFIGVQSGASNGRFRKNTCVTNIMKKACKYFGTKTVGNTCNSVKTAVGVTSMTFVKFAWGIHGWTWSNECAVIMSTTSFDQFASNIANLNNFLMKIMLTYTQRLISVRWDIKDAFHFISCFLPILKSAGWGSISVVCWPLYSNRCFYNWTTSVLELSQVSTNLSNLFCF